MSILRFSVAFAFLAALSGAGCIQKTASQAVGVSAGTTPVKTEFFVFLQGDNDLIRVSKDGVIVSQGELAFQTWTRIAESAPEDCAFHIYYDPNGDFVLNSEPRSGDSRILRWSDRSLIDEKRFRETDSSDPQWLEALLSGALLPDSRKIFVFFGHGDGWRDLEPYDLSAPEARFNYLDTAPLLGRYGVNMFIFDACSMATVEALTAFAGHVQYLIASQFELSVEGIEFGGLPQHLEPSTVSDEKFFVGLYRQLRKDTREAQWETGLNAPLVLYKLEELEAFLREFNHWIDDFSSAAPTTSPERARLLNLLLHNAHPVLRGAVQDDSLAVDLRSALQFASAKLGIRSQSLLSAFDVLLDVNFGSIQFFMPDSKVLVDSGFLPERSWTRSLGNWSLIHTWQENTGGTVL